MLKVLKNLLEEESLQRMNMEIRDKNIFMKVEILSDSSTSKFHDVSLSEMKSLPNLPSLVTIENDDEDDNEDEVVWIPKPKIKSEIALESNQSDKEEVVFIGETENPLSTMPHPRYLCANNHFSNSQINDNQNHMFCSNCFCYVCDIPASECQEWNKHKNAFKSSYWETQRSYKKNKSNIVGQSFSVNPFIYSNHSGFCESPPGMGIPGFVIWDSQKKLWMTYYELGSGMKIFLKSFSNEQLAINHSRYWNS